MKISSPFNTSASNVGNAAMQAANVPWDRPVEIRLRAEGPGETDVYIEVSAPSGFVRRIAIDEKHLAKCRQEYDGPAGIALCQQLVDELATRIRTVVAEALME